MNYRVIFSPEAEEQLAALYGYIASAASPDIAAQYTEAIVKVCVHFPIAAFCVTMCGQACA